MNTQNQAPRPTQVEIYTPHRRLSVNITPTERAGRILVGAAATIAALGHCPLYQKLGFVPKSLRRPS